MDLMTQEDFAQLMQLDGLYYAGRWEYYRKVVELIKGLNITIPLGLPKG